MQANKRFVDAVDFLRRAKICSNAHHALAYVPIESKVCRQSDQAGLFFQVLNLKPGNPHLDS